MNIFSSPPSLQAYVDFAADPKNKNKNSVVSGSKILSAPRSAASHLHHTLFGKTKENELHDFTQVTTKHFGKNFTDQAISSMRVQQITNNKKTILGRVLQQGVEETLNFGAAIANRRLREVKLSASKIPATPMDEKAQQGVVNNMVQKQTETMFSAALTKLDEKIQKIQLPEKPALDPTEIDQELIHHVIQNGRQTLQESVSFFEVLQASVIELNEATQKLTAHYPSPELTTLTEEIQKIKNDLDFSATTPKAKAIAAVIQRCEETEKICAALPPLDNEAPSASFGPGIIEGMEGLAHSLQEIIPAAYRAKKLAAAYKYLNPTASELTATKAHLGSLKDSLKYLNRSAVACRHLIAKAQYTARALDHLASVQLEALSASGTTLSKAELSSLKSELEETHHMVSDIKKSFYEAYDRIKNLDLALTEIAALRIQNANQAASSQLPHKVESLSTFENFATRNFQRQQHATEKQPELAPTDKITDKAKAETESKRLQEILDPTTPIPEIIIEIPSSEIDQKRNALRLATIVEAEAEMVEELEHLAKDHQVAHHIHEEIAPLLSLNLGRIKMITEDFGITEQEIKNFNRREFSPMQDESAYFLLTTAQEIFSNFKDTLHHANIIVSLEEAIAHEPSRLPADLKQRVADVLLEIDDIVETMTEHTQGACVILDQSADDLINRLSPNSVAEDTSRALEQEMRVQKSEIKKLTAEAATIFSKAQQLTVEISSLAK